jgi:hypothetical protein
VCVTGCLLVITDESLELHIKICCIIYLLIYRNYFQKVNNEDNYYYY